MPLRLQSIQRNRNPMEMLSFMGQQDLEEWDAKVQSKDADGNTYFHYTHFMSDVSSGEVIGKLVVTLREMTERKGLFKKETKKEILDMDLTLESEAEVEMGFLNMLPGSSGAIEYYDVELDSHERFQIETVNRHYIPGKIEGTKLKVKASAFPFILSVYDSVDSMNEALHTKEIFGNGLAPTFAAPGPAAIEILRLPADADEISSFLIGTVKSVKDVEVKLGEMKLSFALVRMETALGILPVAMGRSVFNIEGIAPGKIVGMLADIKADFATDQKPVGRSDPQNYEEAREWINNKADEIFNMLTKGLGLAETPDEADFATKQEPMDEQYRLKKRAKQGDSVPQIHLASMYIEGDVVEKDYEKAREWYQKAAEQGAADAQYELGSMYFSGIGVAQDYEKARKWYREAAEQGHAAAMNYMAVIYDAGLGVQQDQEKACKWLQKAAELGDTTAQDNLKRLFPNR